MFPTDTDSEWQVSMETETIPVPEDPPFRILLLGDYSGRQNLANFSDSALPGSKPIEVDRDSFEDLMKRLNTSLRLRLQKHSDETLLLSFRELDDFHPDRIFEQVPIFAELRNIRKMLLDPDSFDEAAAEVYSWLETETGKPEEEVQPVKPDVPESDVGSQTSGNLLEDILGQTQGEAATYKVQTSQETLLSDFIRDVVSPHLVQTDEAEQAKLLGVVDSSTSSLMNKIIHHPEFRALEAAWRGLFFLVRRVETSSELKISLLDLSKSELEEDLQSDDDLSATKMYGVLITETIETHGGEPWALVCGNYKFQLNVEDTAGLIRIGKLAAAAKAPFISYVHPKMLSIDSLAESADEKRWNYKDETEEGKLWTALRTVPEATSIGLSSSRFLGRLPYGDETEPAESFDFEEFTGGFKHEDYLWINPSFACALLLAQSFTVSGWEMGQRIYREIEGLPIHMFKEDGETKTKPCAEVVLTHAASDTLLDQGLMPLISFRDTDRVRLERFQSVAFPNKRLNGRWS